MRVVSYCYNKVVMKDTDSRSIVRELKQHFLIALLLIAFPTVALVSEKIAGFYKIFFLSECDPLLSRMEQH